MKSITTDLWNIIEKDVPADPTGPEAFHAIIQEQQVSTASMVQKLTMTLMGMTLKSEPGQNVQTFANKVTKIAHKIEGSQVEVSNINSLVVKPFLHCDVESFRMFVTNLHMDADRGTSAIGTTILSGAPAVGSTKTWTTAIIEMKNRYRELKAQGLWLATSNKPQQNELKTLKMLQAQLKALQQTVDLGR